MTYMSLLLLLVLPTLVLGHGNIVHPPNWFDRDGAIGMSPGLQCAQGYGLNITGVVTPFETSCFWFNNYTFVEEETLPEYMRTYDGYKIEEGKYVDYFGKHPWRSPGSAPIFSPCGVGGGNPNGCPEGGPHPEDGGNVHFLATTTAL